MKYLLILSTVFFTSFAHAGLKPNLYTCTDATGTISISYSTTSFTGDAQLNYAQLPGTRAEISISAMGTSEILKAESPLGDIVMAVDMRNTIMDEVVSYIGLIIPDVNMPDNEAKVTFETQLVYLKEFTSIAGPAAVKGPLQRTSFKALECEAQFVQF